MNAFFDVVCSLAQRDRKIVAFILAFIIGWMLGKVIDLSAIRRWFRKEMLARGYVRRGPKDRWL